MPRDLDELGITNELQVAARIGGNKPPAVIDQALQLRQGFPDARWNRSLLGEVRREFRVPIARARSRAMPAITSGN